MDWPVSNDAAAGHTAGAGLDPQWSSPRPLPPPVTPRSSWMSAGVIAVLVLGSLCLVLGLIIVINGVIIV